MQDDYEQYLRESQKRIEDSRVALNNLGKQLKFDLLGTTTPETTPNELKLFESNNIYDGLAKISPILANSYAQVKRDMVNPDRISWIGTAHEIRQIVSTMLHLLAPDDQVKAQPNYKQAKDTSGPTQIQRVNFILKQYNAGSKTQEVVETVTKFDELVGEIVRGVYSRASNAAHTQTDKKETKRLLAYFEAFSHDLLNLD